MMTFHRSWIFILPLLLVRPGSALPIYNYGIDVFPREVPSVTAPPSTGSSPAANVAAIIGGVLAGVAATICFFAWYSRYRKRKSKSHAEEGSEEEWSPGWFSNFGSEVSPKEKVARFNRFRDAFGRRGEKKSQEGILPVYQAKLPPGSTDSISPPPPTVPGHTPRYPSILERGHSKTARHPPPPHDLSRMPSVTESLRSAPAGDRVSRRKVQIPPRALLVPPPGRPLPGLAGPIGVSQSPVSASNRRSWFSKRLSKHPFIPLRDDPSLHFPPSPLNPDRYQPSRQHLEARLDARSPVKRQPVPLYEEGGGATKHARIVEALQSSGLRTPVPPNSSKSVGMRTPLPLASSKLPLNSPAYI